MSRFRQCSFLLGLASFVFCMSSTLALELPSVFSDGMVMQREMPVRFWGWGEAGESISVEIEDTEITTVVDPEGRWELLFPAQTAGGPFQVGISASEDSQALNDVYFGDVWLASGQSNMEWPLNGNIDNFEAEIADSDYPLIRCFDIENKYSRLTLDRLPVKGSWVKASPETSGEFSAVAWFFAKNNHLEKNVPVGIINSSWGGTPAQAWTPASELVGLNIYGPEAVELLDPSVDWDAKVQANEDNNALKWSLLGNKDTAKTLDVVSPSFDATDWSTVDLPNKDELTHIVWFRKSFHLDEIPELAEISFGNLVEDGMVFINGELVWEKQWDTPVTPLSFEASLLKKGTNEIVLRSYNGWDNRVWIGRKGEFWLKLDDLKINIEGAWKYSNCVEPKIPDVVRYEHTSSFLYNAMIHPIAGYSIKGAIWYQGESNTDHPELYEELFRRMIQSWRIVWKQGSFPFVFTQLANFMEVSPDPQDSQWAALREAQRHTLALPNTGMAVTIDIGDANDIHPRNKQDVGKRLWLAAREVAYDENLVSSGPVLREVSSDGNVLRLVFDSNGSGLVGDHDGNVRGFAIAGEDGVFHWAKAKLDGNAVLLTCESVDTPVKVRYAWADNPICNLFNKEGLPASPFETVIPQ